MGSLVYASTPGESPSETCSWGWSEGVQGDLGVVHRRKPAENVIHVGGTL